MQNRLADASSPYLRQHAGNPVHWQPWDDIALERSKREDKPIFLSVGYSACHWCHVMEHESFEDEEIARILNENFVSIKVDREERPDLDDIYMTAVQLATGRGGWPMTLFLTPDKTPFFAGTYFPKDDHPNMTGFRSVASEIAKVWKDERDKVDEIAGKFAEALKEAVGAELESSGGPLEFKTITAGVAEMKRLFDTGHGGFGAKPKFPPHQALTLFLYLGERHERKDCMQMAEKTLQEMMLGGIHDHVGGGFHRYSTDEIWLLPHFEKMLYDNALLLRNYAHAYSLTENPEYRRVCDRIASWLFNEMVSPDRTFYSALDADSEGEEGKFYVWEANEIRDALGAEAAEFMSAFGIAEIGNFRDEATGKPTGMNIPHLRDPQGGRWDDALEKLLDRRSKRVRPGLDDKVLVAWNGLMITGLAAAGYHEPAERAAEAILKSGKIPHQFVDGVPKGEPFLDLAYFVEGLLELSDATGEERWYYEAERIYDEQLMEFHDDERGGWYFTSDRHEQLFGRLKMGTDQAAPNPGALATRCAVLLDRRDQAALDLRANLGWMERAPMASEAFMLTLAMFLDATTVESIAPRSEVRRVTVDLDPPEAVIENGKARFKIHIRVPEGCHINPEHPADERLIPTEVEVKGFKKHWVHVPEGQGTLVGDVPIAVEAEAPEGKEGEGKALVKFQMCTDTECLQPETRELSLVWYRE